MTETSPYRVIHGRAACEAGDPDHHVSDPRTSAIDTIANVLHALAAEQPEHDARAVLDTALNHYLSEQGGETV